MTSLSPNYSLILYNSTTDQSATFATWRADIDGPASTSNFYRIDTALTGIQTQVTALQSASPVVVVPSVYAAGNYIATGVTGITAYTTNQLIVLSLDTTSSGAVSLNINSLGLKNVMKIDNSGAAVAMSGTELRINKLYLFKYDGVEWIWVNPQTASQINITGTSGNVVTVNSDNTLLGTTTQAALISLTTDAATSKATPVNADEIPLADSAASFGLKKLTWANLVSNVYLSLGTIIDALTGKTTPVGADEFAIADSAASFVAKKLSLTNLVAALKILIATDTLAAPTDITTNNATTAAHGFRAKYTNDATKFMNEAANTVTISAQFFINGASLLSATTSGFTAPTQVEMATNKENFSIPSFPNGSQKYGVVTHALPSDYGGGTITAVFYWTANSTSTNSVIWGIQGRAYADNDALDATWGTAIEVTDANGSSAYTNRISAATSAVTIAGSPTASQLVTWRIYRLGSGSDNLAVAALLQGILITYTRS